MSEHISRVCKCENCGNEAEMVVTCSLPDAGQASPPAEQPKTKSAAGTRKVKGTATCSHCGNEADMWIDM